jgi:hypothetical protein
MVDPLVLHCKLWTVSQMTAKHANANTLSRPPPPFRLTTRIMRRMVQGSCLMVARSSWTGLPSAWGARAWCLQQVSHAGGTHSRCSSCTQELVMQVVFGTLLQVHAGAGVAVTKSLWVAVGIHDEV